MAVILVTTPRAYVGQAADSKPTALAGSGYYETDTRRAYVSTGSAWLLLPTEGPAWLRS